MATTYTYPSQWDALAIKVKTDDAGVHTDDTDFTDFGARLAAELTTAGIIRGLKVSPGTGMGLEVSGGVAAVDGLLELQGRYLVSTSDEEMQVPASDITQNRIDRLYLVVRDNNYDGSGRGIVAFGYVSGTPGEGMPEPDPNWTAYIPLAIITVGAGAVDHDGIAITDTSFPARSAIGGGGDPGDLKATAATAAPDGWLVCQGQEVAIDDYPALYAAIGDTYGSAVAGSFRLPDLREKFPMGVGGGSSLGDTGGSSSHAHSNPNVNDNGNHNHSQGNTGNAGSHSHPTPTYSGWESSHSHGNPQTSWEGAHDHNQGSLVARIALAFNEWAMSRVALGSSYNANAAADKSQKDASTVSTSYGTDVVGDTGSTPNHRHSQGSTGTGSAHRHTVSSTNGAGNHNHPTPNTNHNGTHAHSQGSTGSENSIPPYLAVRWLIKT